MKHLVLIGGGHTHRSVLQVLTDARINDLKVTLITPENFQFYSGMLPSWMSGQYEKEQTIIDLRDLTNAAKVAMINQRVIGMDADRSCVLLENGEQLDYDFASIDIGSETNASWLEMSGEKLLPVKPLKNFFERWPMVMEVARVKEDFKLLVVGGGAAGVELALAAKQAFTSNALQAKVDLVTSESGILADHPPSVIARVEHCLKKVDIHLHRHRAVGIPEGVLLSDGTQLEADIVVAATGTRAQIWLQLSKLDLDENGYIVVDQFHRCVSHANVFAAGVYAHDKI